MELLIDKSKKLSSIQNEFQKQFPFLKIEFYKEAHALGKGSPNKSTLNNDLTIADVQKNSLTGTIIVNGLLKVSELETAFEKTFGLAVQVFRKSGNVWLQTTATDDWTLAEQNLKAMEIEEQTAPEKSIIDASDRQELE